MIDPSSQPPEHVSDFECAVASRVYPGESECGDRCLVQSLAGGALFVVVDGLGHGHAAAEAARRAIAIAHGHADTPVTSIVRTCHEGIVGTRGVAMTVASFDQATRRLTWTGVGNVEGMLLRARSLPGADREAVLLRGGVVGYQIPPLADHEVTLESGDIVIFATDGIREGFANDVAMRDSPQDIARHILHAWATGRDDALVLVARYRGEGG